MQQVLAITKALSDETRIRILIALKDGELCLCQIVELFRLAPSTVSRHLDLLCRAGLVGRRKEGKWHYFRIVGREASALARHALKWVRVALRGEPSTTQDVKRLRRIRKKDLTELCACYKK